MQCQQAGSQSCSPLVQPVMAQWFTLWMASSGFNTSKVPQNSSIIIPRQIPHSFAEEFINSPIQRHLLWVAFILQGSATGSSCHCSFPPFIAVTCFKVCCYAPTKVMKYRLACKLLLLPEFVTHKTFWNDRDALMQGSADWKTCSIWRNAWHAKQKKLKSSTSVSAEYDQVERKKNHRNQILIPDTGKEEHVWTQKKYIFTSQAASRLLR